MSEKLREIRREDFGPGNAGELSYSAVASGIPCETYIDGDKTKCGKPPIGTIDADIGASLEFFPFCSEEHALALQEQIGEELGKWATLKHNGFRRSSAISETIVFEDQET